MFSYDSSKRPTVEQLRNHPWMTKPFSMKMTRQVLLDNLQTKRSVKTATSSRDEEACRAINDPMLEFVRQTSASQLNLYKFNDMTDHDIDVAPGVLWEDLQVFNTDFFDGKMKLEQNAEKKYFKIAVKNEDGGHDLEVKIKFLDLNSAETNEECDEDEPSNRLRVRFTKKRGDLSKWYQIFNDMKDAVLEDILLAPKLHHEEILTSAFCEGGNKE